MLAARPEPAKSSGGISRNCQTGAMRRRSPSQPVLPFKPPMISPIAAEFEQALKRGDVAAAAALARARVDAAPADAGAWHLLGHALDTADQADAAERAFARARQLVPASTRLRFTLAGMCFTAGDWTRAARHFRACAVLEPLWKDAWNNLARAELKRGDAAAALSASARAAALPPEDVATLKLWAIAAELAQAPPADVLAIRERIQRAAPGDPEAEFLLAMAHWALRDHARTHRHLERCLQLAPDYLTARWVAAQLPRQSQFADDAERAAYLQQWRDGIGAIEAMRLDAPIMHAHCEAIMQMHTNFYLAYLGGVFRDEQQRYGAVMQRIARRVCGDAEVTPRPIVRRRRRIGVISGMLQQHSVTKLFMPAFTGLDRERFEVIGFCPRSLRDAWTDRYERELDGFHHGTATPAQWAARIAGADLDVLVYLDVGMYGLTSSLAALRLAPVQAVLWGHPITTGLASMDWFISCAAMEPPDHADHYSEKTLLLPGIGCVFEPPEFTPDAGFLAGIERRPDQVYAACLQTAEKLTPRHDALFAKLLRAAPALCLSFAPGLIGDGLDRFAERLRRACAEAAVDFDARVRVYGRLAQAEFAAVGAGQDFILDALDWSGGVTALETFWLDKPILTLPGRLMRGRHTLAMLEAMAIDELIAADEHDYLARAARLATDADWRAALAARVAERKSLLYRDARAAAALAAWLGEVQPG
jgi:protein O-GlcNAc transferase